MTYLRGVANPRDPTEALVFSYWIVVVQLLKQGITWDAIQTLSEDEVSFILGIIAAFNQKEEEDEQRAMAASQR
jgi:mannitol/fructose-specific phosphotransferase system IIA component (Ntr-type)